jgi:3-oxoacyl-ACP reductase-like protein
MRLFLRRYSVNVASLSELDDHAGRALTDSAPKSTLSASGAAAKTSTAASAAATSAATLSPALESITRKDVVGALKSLMVAAGLPMSMDQERLAESIMQLKASVAEERCSCIMLCFCIFC